MNSFERLAEVACRGDLDFELLERYCAATGVEIQAASNSLALHMATNFLADALDFDECDVAMNSLFSVMASEPYFEITDGAIPALAFAIYRAFDEGEYFHPDDLPDDVPALKYTRPMLEAILGGERVG
jgi:hypothetical protein